MKTGEFIKAKRLRAQLSQDQLGETLGLTSGQFISNVERGISLPHIDHVEKLAAALNVSVSELKNIIGGDKILKIKEKWK